MHFKIGALGHMPLNHIHDFVILMITVFDIHSGSAGPLTIPSWALNKSYTSPDGSGIYVTRSVRSAGDGL